MKQKVIYILLDAMRWDYIDPIQTPFLHNMAKDGKYFKKVKPSFSFCERAEIFAGLKPHESGYFTAIGYDPDKSPYRKLWMLNFFHYLDFLVPKNFIYPKYRRLIGRLFKAMNIALSPYLIPWSMLRNMKLTEDEFDFRDERAFGGRQNIFSDCKKRGVKIFYDSFTALNFKRSSTDQERIQMIRDNIDGDYGLYLLYIGRPDQVGHFEGPESLAMNESLKRLDAELEDLYHFIVEKKDDISVIFNGDHGMCDVEYKLDAKAAISKTASKYRLRFGRDFLFFLDSTIIRFWFMNEFAERLFIELLGSDEFLEHGHIIDKEDLEKFPVNDRTYGDLMWIARKGVLISPDYFHQGSDIRGMHGYLSDDEDCKGMCIINGSHTSPATVEEIELVEVYNLIRKELKFK